MNSHTIGKVGLGKTYPLNSQVLYTECKVGFNSTVVALGRILLSEIQLKTCLLDPHYVQDPEKIRVSISGPAWTLLWLPACVGAALAILSVLCATVPPERGLSQYALFVELYDLQIFAFLWSGCRFNNDRLFWVAGRCLRDFVHSGCCVRWYEWCVFWTEMVVVLFSTSESLSSSGLWIFIKCSSCCPCHHCWACRNQ